ncbi:MAG: IS66 family insertion sequence element accessory protein TnpB [Ignavibacteria bacterium]
MLKFNEGTPIFLRTGTTDMRKEINGLAALVRNEMNLNPFENGYFVFCNKSRYLLKILYWDKTGFALWYKRLEKAKFPWPVKETDVRKLTVQQIEWLLDGIDFFHAHEKLTFSIV